MIEEARQMPFVSQILNALGKAVSNVEALSE